MSDASTAADAAYRAFVSGLERDDAVPPSVPLLGALHHGLRGQWQAAHALAQAQHDADGAWVHAWLHRVEGDLDNAEYWYGRARRAPGRGDTRAEGLSIARELIGRSTETG